MALNPNPIDYFAIQNTISQYCIALDTKNWTLLDDVFVQDVDAKYPFGGAIKGVQALADKIQDRLKHITSQHAITTQHLTISTSGKEAQAVSYFTGIHFGQGKWKGQHVTAWGKYVDELVLQPGSRAALPGASGKWIITKRTTEFMGRLGEEKVMEGEDAA